MYGICYTTYQSNKSSCFVLFVLFFYKIASWYFLGLQIAHTNNFTGDTAPGAWATHCWIFYFRRCPVLKIFATQMYKYTEILAFISPKLSHVFAVVKYIFSWIKHSSLNAAQNLVSQCKLGPQSRINSYCRLYHQWLKEHIENLTKIVVDYSHKKTAFKCWSLRSINLKVKWTMNKTRKLEMNSSKSPDFCHSFQLK